MKDIDFDELDRAVSSVLAQKTPSDKTADSAKPIQTTETTQAEAPVKADENTSAVPAVVPSRTKPQSPARSLAVKRRGKFMDVMHPSADMAPKSKPAPALPEHVAVTVKPLSSGIAPDPEKVGDVDEPYNQHKLVAKEPTVEPVAELDETHTLVGAEPAPAGSVDEVEKSVETLTPFVGADADKVPSLPESNDDKTPEEENTPGALPLAAETDATEQIAPESSSLTSFVPQETPFLTDTKVDKRPLGGFVDAEQAAFPDGSKPEEPVADTQTAPVVPLPRELQSDVVEVESAQETSEPVAATAGPFAANVAAPQVDDDRVDGHPLFDTSTYHEPMIAVHESTVPGWLKWAIGLILCLVVGAGVGFFLFSAGI